MGQISESVIRIASSYVGKVEETDNDAGWLRDLINFSDNPTGWNPGESYCIAALLSIFKNCCKEKPFPPRMSKGTQQFWMNAVAVNYTSRTPTRGDIVIFREGLTGSGHAGLVIEVREDGIDTIEFNTSDNIAGDQRNGGGCFKKTRKFADFSQITHPKFWIRGYVLTSTL